jgi:hypothetical protein
MLNSIENKFCLAYNSAVFKTMNNIFTFWSSVHIISRKEKGTIIIRTQKSRIFFFFLLIIQKSNIKHIDWVYKNNFVVMMYNVVNRK